ncbi:MAG: LLM class flavin-dependent oxidoreductase [Candidatus Binatia bacterium]
MKKIQFGVRVPNSGPLSSVENIIKATKKAENLGFDSVWVHDHVVWSSEMHKHHISSGATEAVTDTQDANFFEAMSMLAYLAAETKRITLGVACLIMPCRNPIYAAKQATTIDWLSKGRLIIGVGLGSKATRESDEFGVFGVPMERRGDRADEYIEAMKAVWTQPIASYQGEFIRFKNAEIHPKPRQKPHPPVWVGGWMKLAAKRAAKYGDGWIPGWLSPKEMKVGCDILAQTAKENGRDPTRITIAVEKLATIAETHDEGMNLAMPTIKASSTSYERDINSMQFALDRHIFGSVDDVRRRLDEFIENGVQHFELKIIYPTLESLSKQMVLWSEQIIPHYD